MENGIFRVAFNTLASIFFVLTIVTTANLKLVLPKKHTLLLLEVEGSFCADFAGTTVRLGLVLLRCIASKSQKGKNRKN